MNISKTIFKEYTRCPRVCALDDLYKKKLGTHSSIYGADDEKADFIELLGTMFDVETGEDFIDVTDAQLEALLPYYNRLEYDAMQVARKVFGKDIVYNLETKKQKLFSFRDNDHSYYCYLDGYQEKADEINVFEVKATTSKKFMELGPTVKGKQSSIFEKGKHIIRLHPNPEMEPKKAETYYQKLFDRYHSCGRYVFDLAVERFFIEQSLQTSGITKKINFYLVVLNADYIFDGTYGEDGWMVYGPDKNDQELVVFIDLTDLTKEYQTKIKALKNVLVEHIERMDATPIKLGTFCERKKQGKCAFIKTCWKKALEDGSILEYMMNHHGFKDENGVRHETMELINQGLDKIDSIPKKWLEARPNNLIQRFCYDEKKEYVNEDKIKRGMKQLVYPIYHLDFESFPSPLPRFKGEKPYQQSVFQYSLHIEKEPRLCDKNSNHYHYLAKDNEDHREELIQKLIHDIDLKDGGTVLVYNKSFEHTRIKEFALLFPEYKKELDAINEHMFDLIDLVATKSEWYQALGFSTEESKLVNYYHSHLHGSYSIKKVLPVFSDLTYEGLAVANGTQAIAAYAQFKHLEKEELDQLQADLIEYCKQDTWAMAVVLWGLMDKVGL